MSFIGDHTSFIKHYMSFHYNKTCFFFPASLHYMSFTTMDNEMLKLLQSTFVMLMSELNLGCHSRHVDRNLFGNALENVFGNVRERSLLRIVKWSTSLCHFKMLYILRFKIEYSQKMASSFWNS